MKPWVEDVLVRGLKTAIQTFIASVTAVTVLSEVDWYLVAISTAGAFVMSVLMNISNHLDTIIESKESD